MSGKKITNNDSQKGLVSTFLNFIGEFLVAGIAAYYSLSSGDIPNQIAYVTGLIVYLYLHSRRE